MDRLLNVYWDQNLVGVLKQDHHGQVSFQYSVTWLAPPSARPLSHSLALQPDPFRSNECRAFFAGLLPESTNRDVLARNLGISPRNDFALLERIGGDCAGAVTFLPPGLEPAVGEYHYRPMEYGEMAAIVQSLPSRPLLAGTEGVRLSLAGAQDKLALFHQDDKFYLPLGGAPSSHILKPAASHFPDLVFNEAYCMELAISLGLDVAPAKPGRVEEWDYLLVERYDRYQDSPGHLQRIHQEDFCQALGIVPEMKYQAEGGPGLGACFQLVRAVSAAPVIDLQRLLDAVIFNHLIGNNDAHGKNFSLLHTRQGTRLAPLYDLVSTLYYPELSLNRAMKLGKTYDSRKIQLQDFDHLAQEAGLGRALVRKLTADLTRQLRQTLEQVSPGHESQKKLKLLILDRCQKTLELFSQI